MYVFYNGVYTFGTKTINHYILASLFTPGPEVMKLSQDKIIAQDRILSQSQECVPETECVLRQKNLS